MCQGASYDRGRSKHPWLQWSFFGGRRLGTRPSSGPNYWKFSTDMSGIQHAKRLPSQSASEASVLVTMTLYSDIQTAYLPNPRNHDLTLLQTKPLEWSPSSNTHAYLTTQYLRFHRVLRLLPYHSSIGYLHNSNWPTSLQPIFDAFFRVSAFLQALSYLSSRPASYM